MEAGSLDPAGSWRGICDALGSVTRPRRLDSVDYLGMRQYFLTISTGQRTRWFTDATVVAEVTLQFLRVAGDEQVALSAYCFMPDHLHALVTAGSEAADFQRFVRLAKQRSGFWFTQARRQRLWQESYFDRTLRENESPTEVIKYIVGNPVRAGLVETPAEYPFWGSQIYSREEILELIAIESVSRV